MGSEAEKEAYAAFEEKMKRTIYLDTLSPHVTEPDIRSALDEFGCVTAVQFIPNYTEPNFPFCRALVELETAKQAAIAVEKLGACPFVMFGLPLIPKHAKAEMFEDRPEKPGTKIKLLWLHPNDPAFEVGQSMKQAVIKHEAEAAYLRKVKYGVMENLHRKMTCGRLAEDYTKDNASE